MLKRILRQRTLPWIGGFKEVLSQVLFWGTILNFIMIAATFYYTTLQHVWPWFTVGAFIGFVAAGLVVAFVLEYRFITPSIWAFRSKQMFEHESKLVDRLEEILKRLEKLEKEEK